jgi:hypothetical protein
VFKASLKSRITRAALKHQWAEAYDHVSVALSLAWGRDKGVHAIISKLHSHVVNLRLAAQGITDYSATLNARDAATARKYRALIKRVTEE